MGEEGRNAINNNMSSTNNIVIIIFFFSFFCFFTLFVFVYVCVPKEMLFDLCGTQFFHFCICSIQSACCHRSRTQQSLFGWSIWAPQGGRESQAVLLVPNHPQLYLLRTEHHRFEQQVVHFYVFATICPWCCLGPYRCGLSARCRCDLELSQWLFWSLGGCKSDHHRFSKIKNR